ncbi:protein of unknown function DUF721 [Rippkaea orientalis PCC 8801]|uniref:DUF721 domain-containing protein n=1 Tax=Rippkaea orientalis (strain PCC 8801 / RF-1) TaxID=41431 RepID=B7JUT0_RIPO1|nr:DciA family protein [Rippkaea orientalis]ACK65624.1 protein of unknown function DUF721 [Rippkaea orientalis PCC 8801]
MSFNSLNHLLNALENKPEWAQYQRYQRLCQCWNQIIDSKVALHTRPLYLQRNIFWVATSSAVWAQTLSLQRYTLLKQLNHRLSCDPLGDIRFSCAQWHDASSQGEKSPDLPHPSEVNLPNSLRDDPQIPPAKTPQEAFERWRSLVQARSLFLPLCPQCHCPTPPGELQRWSICVHCAARQWQTNSLCPPDSPQD